jgi:hypothetical protein
MKAFYSLIKISPNPTAGDLIAVGIIMADPSGVFIKISENKLKLAHSLLGEDSFLFDFIVKQIKNKVTEANQNMALNRSQLFTFDHIFTEEYFEYLNRYSNNLIQFSKPISLLENSSFVNIHKLYNLLVDADAESELQNETHDEVVFLQKIEEKLVSRVKDKVHTHICFDEKIIPSLYFRFEMDCIGLNGIFTGAKSLYFNKSYQTIHTQVSDYITLITEIEKKFDKVLSSNNFYLICDEPKKASKDYLLWEKFSTLGKIKVIASDETEMIAEQIEKSEAKTFLTL